MMNKFNGYLRASVFWGCIAVCCTGVQSVQASPTSNEFAHCHEQVSRRLEACLNDHPGETSSPCWKQAQRTNRICYQELFALHSTHAKRDVAMKEAAAAKRRNENH